MNYLTIVYAYYNTPGAIPELVKNWNSWNGEAKRSVSIIVVDDGSIEKFYDIYKKNFCDCNIKIYEILKNIEWNQPGAFNLGIHNAETEWVMIMPVDRLIPVETISEIINYSLDKNNFYFVRDKIKGIEIGSPPGIILLTKEAFIDCGMFDEDFCGNYGYDDILLKKQLIKKYTPILSDWHLDVLPHISHQHRLIRNTEVNRQLLEKKLEGDIPISKNYFRFKWRKIEL